MTSPDSSSTTATASASPGIVGLVVGTLRNFWRWLTSMRVALLLLFLVAVAAIPGALLPQRSLNTSKVEEYLAVNGRTAEIFDRLQLFDVFSSWWFTAIYVLLFISLIGCILPRSLDHYRAMRTPPVKAPKNLSRLPHHAEVRLPVPAGRDAADYAEEVKSQLRTRLKRWHTQETEAAEDRAGAWSLAAERGYLRELGNLVFHLGLVAILATVALGRMYYYESQTIVIAGAENNQLCTTAVSNFDSFRAGALVDGTDLTPLCVAVHDFSADYLPNGQAEMFTSHVSYAVGEEIYTDVSEWEDYTLMVNHPLRVAGDRIYLQGHGFAPIFTVTWPNGETRTQMIQFRPDDLTFFLSSGVVRFDPPAGMYPDLAERRQHQIAIEGLFAPTAQLTGESGELLSSSYPAMRDPAVAVDIYVGDAGLDVARPTGVFTLDSFLVETGLLTKEARVNLFEGESTTLPDGTQIRFDGAMEYANLQVSHDPFQPWVLVSSLAMLGGLVLSMLIKRRRVWVRIHPASTTEDGSRAIVLDIGGLARTDRAGWGEEFDLLVAEFSPAHAQDDSTADPDADTSAGVGEVKKG